MKKAISLLLFLVLGTVISAQARLGSSFQDLKNDFPDKVFTVDKTSNGVYYAQADFDNGTFVYYFDPYGYTNLCLQIPYNNAAVNAQAEIYNSRYTIKSPTSWMAYLNNGYIMMIELVWNEPLQTYVFIYSPST